MEGHSFDIDGEDYEDQLTKGLMKELPDHAWSSFESLDKEIWDLVEADLTGYVQMVVDHMRDKLWMHHTKIQQDIKELIDPKPE